jgi:hypothetical protein
LGFWTVVPESVCGMAVVFAEMKKFLPVSLVLLP